MTQKGSYGRSRVLTVRNGSFHVTRSAYAAAHRFADLSLRASKDLFAKRPSPIRVYLLNAEALEPRARPPKRRPSTVGIIAMNPLLPGMHRGWRVLLSGSLLGAVAEAKKNFERNWRSTPKTLRWNMFLRNFRKTNDLPGAVSTTRGAIRINADFTEAYLGLGSALVAQATFAEPFRHWKIREAAPDSPTGTTNWRLAYNARDARMLPIVKRITAESGPKPRTD